MTAPAHSEVARFGVSMDEDLLRKFDELVARKGYANRSQALADLVRAALVEQEWETDDTPTAATVSMVYDHHDHDIGHKLTHLQHDHRDLVVSTMHVHLDHDNCLETLILRGPARAVRALGERLVACKGVKHGRLMMTTEGKRL